MDKYALPTTTETFMLAVSQIIETSHDESLGQALFTLFPATLAILSVTELVKIV